MKNWQGLYIHVRELLQQNLPNYLTYHNWEHTEHVLQMSEIIAEFERVTNNELVLLKTAALYHDAGFISCFDKGHEEESIHLAQKELPLFGYSELEIQIISNMIWATKVPQQPKNKLECILADADLEYIGTENLEPFAYRLYLELKYSNPEMTLNDWNLIQIHFLQSHVFHTRFCIENRSETKAKHLKRLSETLEIKS